jgi:hypothetical protein
MGVRVNGAVDARVVSDLDFAAVRAFIADQLGVAGLNVYAYPDPQVEYPALVLPVFGSVLLHASVLGGEVVTWNAELWVADPEPETGVAAIEQLVLTVAYALENLTGAPYAQLVVRSIGNVRTREAQGAMSADLVLDLHA